MKRYVIAALVSLALIPLTLLAWGFGLPSQYGESFLGELREKYALLCQPSEKPRLILVGGSAVTFGVDGTLLEELLPQYEVVNFGMYAALGIRPMLDLSREQLRQDDLVLLMPEQQEQSLSGYLGSEALWQAADGAFGLLFCARWEDLGALIGQFPRFAASKAAYFVQGGPQLPEVYRKASFDETGNLRTGLCEANTMPGGVDPTMPISFDPGLLSEEFCTLVNEYTRQAELEGATVWYHFPPMNQAAVESGSDPDVFCDRLRETLDCELAGSPHTSMMEAGWFYDTNFHLNEKGRQVFTCLLARDIKAMLGDSSPTPEAAVEMPALEQPQSVQGDDRDANCFVYEAVSGGWQITGLSESAGEQQELILPASWQGQPVTGLSADALNGAQALKTLVIQQNITALPDGAFAGCPALETVVLLQTDPAALLVGQNLLEGSSCTIAVPSESYDRYCLSYNWSPYADRLTRWEDSPL